MFLYFHVLLRDSDLYIHDILRSSILHYIWIGRL